MFNKIHKIGDTIAKLRKEKGWTQIELAEKLQVSDKAVSKWESNKGDPSVEFLPMLAELFDVTLDYLMTGKEQEEKIVTMSKLELCAKKDDPKVLEKFSYNSAHIKDEDGYSLMYYIKKYESLKVLKALIDDCSHQTHYMHLFPKSQFDLPELLLLIKIDRERIVLKNITNSKDSIRLYLDNLNSNSIWKEERNKKEISEGFKKIINYLIESFDKLTKEQQEYYFDLQDKAMICKQTCWSQAYPYFIDEAYRCNKKLFKKLLDKLMLSNSLYNQKIEEIHKEGRGEYNWINNQKRYLNEKYLYVNVLPETVLFAIKNEDYDIANSLNKLTKDKISNDVFEHAKIKNDKKLSDKEKSIKLCIHEGILNIDELLSTKDYGLIKDNLYKYPINYIEMFNDMVKNKNYKNLFKTAVDMGLNTDYIIKERLEEFEAYLINEFWINGKSATETWNRKLVDEFKKYQESNFKYCKDWETRKNCRYLQVNKTITINDILLKLQESRDVIIENLAFEEAKNKITKDLSKEFFEHELENNNIDRVVINLCVKLEAILKYDYRYEGDFQQMLSKYCETFNTNDDECNNYDPNTPRLLNKLRMYRNGMVHARAEEESLTKDEIKYCINFICDLEKKGR